MKRVLKIAVTGVFFLLTCIYASAQVTIGSTVEPVKAALLDLKSFQAHADSTTTTTGGLVLPRVKLVDKLTLEPFIATNSTEWNLNNQAKTRADHIGLIVYNLSNDANFRAGLYLWTGADWKPMAVASTYIYLPAFKINGSAPSINLYEDVYKKNLNPSVLSNYASSYGTGTGTETGKVVVFPDYSSKADDFYYVVTYYDSAVITISGITDAGVMSYSKVGTDPLPENAYINVVMIRK